MGEEIKIGEEVLDYIADLEVIRNDLEEVYADALRCKDNLSHGAYKGKAKKEMKIFFDSLESHLQRMLFLYGAASSYITNAYQTMYYNEEQLVDWVINRMEEQTIHE